MTDTRCLSVIVPLYNVAVYMPALVRTLAGQDQNLMEVIFVNDGSPDDTETTLRAALEAHPLQAPWRILVKPNGGLADARNHGMANSELPFVAFLDPDDQITKNYYRTLMDRLEQTGADIAISSSIEVWPDGRERPCMYPLAHHHQRDAAQWLLSYDWSACTKIFRRRLFEDALFDVGIRYEDLAVVPYLTVRAASLCTSDTAIYYYYRHEGSITLEGDYEKELKILESTDLIGARLRELGHEVLAWRLLQKVLVTSFVPRVTSRYPAAKSRDFAHRISAYLAHHAPKGAAFGSGMRVKLTRLLMATPGPARWAITGLYKLATLHDRWRGRVLSRS